MTSRAILISLICLGSVTIASASRQVRDTGARLPAGTSTISGTVISTETPVRPIGRAIVTIASSDTAAQRTVITDENGRFTFDALPAGRFTVAARKAAYVTGAYGATRPGRAGTPISLAASQQIAIEIPLTRGAILAGVVRDANGNPVQGAQVGAVNLRETRVEDLLSAGQSTSTDDRGAFRIFGLPPGEYVVSAIQRSLGAGEIGSRSASEIDALFAELQRRTNPPSVGVGGQAGAPVRSSAPLPTPASVTYAPTYYPGTPLFTNAERLRVGAAEERRLDFVVAAVPTATIEGVVASGDGQLLANVQISITSAGPRPALGTSAGLVLAVPPGPDGKFKYTNVPPGHYTLMARSSRTAPPTSQGRAGGGGGGAMVIGPGSAGPPVPAGGYQFAKSEVDVFGQNLTGLSLLLQSGVKVSGKVEFEATTLTPPEDLTRVRVTVSPPTGTSYSISGATIVGNTFSAVSPPALQSDGTFEATGVAPGPYQLRATLPADASPDWWLRSAVVSGRDVMDLPLEVGTTDIRDAVLTFSDRHSELTGTLRTAAGQAASNYFVIVFTTDRTLWRAGARRIRVTRPGTDGVFNVRDLPAGEYHLAALSDVEPNEWNDAGFLDQVVAASLRVAIGPGEKKIQDLRIAQ